MLNSEIIVPEGREEFFSKDIKYDFTKRSINSPRQYDNSKSS